MFTRSPRSLGPGEGPVLDFIAMKITNGVGIDAQCASYLIDAMTGITAPSGNLAYEKMALLRSYLYIDTTLWVTPTVRSECQRIRDQQRRELHDSFISVLFGEWPITDAAAVQSRAQALERDHSGKADCRIFAEAEQVGMRWFLSYDEKFTSRLRGKSSTLCLLKPSEYWVRLAIPSGAAPRKAPHATNPLSREAWWRW